MLTNILYLVKNHFFSISLVSSVSIYALYLLSTRFLLLSYRSKYREKPYHYKMFRLYNEKLISNAPSRKEKSFYIAANKITRVFNAMLLVSVLVFVVACFS
jgi:hypothetical protein